MAIKPIPPTLGIVGHAADKFTTTTELLAKQAIHDLIAKHNPQCIVSGGCHLGGIDLWAEEIAIDLGIKTLIHKPATRSWSTGYKPRNLLIAKDSTIVACVVVREYPPEYNGMRFKGCYHCGNRNERHVKSGGCYTALRCNKREWVFI